jgi:hypothetical protein
MLPKSKRVRDALPPGSLWDSRKPASSDAVLDSIMSNLVWTDREGFLQNFIVCDVLSIQRKENV